MLPARRSVVVGLLLVSACATVESDDPILGEWASGGARWIFRADHTVEPHRGDMERDTQVATIIYPRIRWQRIGSDRYALLYWRSWLPPHERQERVDVELRDGELRRLTDRAAIFARA
ncbi:MAG: hypothetical protein AB7Q23_08055 [Hyphomonadaceae bacterium]